MRHYPTVLRLLGLLLGVLALSLPVGAQTDSLRQEMLRGNLSGMETYLASLTKSQRRTLDSRVLLAELAIAHLDLEAAREQVEGLRSLRRLTDTQRETIEQLSQQTTTAERIYSGLTHVTLYERVEGSAESILGRLRQETGHLGEVSRQHFVSADGREQWRVLTDSTGVDRLVVISRLGDGSWDSDGAREVEILGLEGGALAYPYVAPDGETITIAYRGPESLGGYDLFVSRYDRDASRILVPQQLPAPYNTLASDLALLRDDERGVSWLLTDRGTTHPSHLALYALSTETDRETVVSPERGWLLGDSLTRATSPLPPRRGQEISRPGDRREPLFYVGERAITGPESLTGREAQHFLGEYIESAMRLESLRERLGRLRESYAADRSRGETILRLEEEERELSSRLGELRNRVITLEKLMK